MSATLRRPSRYGFRCEHTAYEEIHYPTVSVTRFLCYRPPRMRFGADLFPPGSFRPRTRPAREPGSPETHCRQPADLCRPGGPPPPHRSHGRRFARRLRPAQQASFGKTGESASRTSVARGRDTRLAALVHVPGTRLGRFDPAGRKRPRRTLPGRSAGTPARHRRTVPRRRKDRGRQCRPSGALQRGRTLPLHVPETFPRAPGHAALPALRDSSRQAAADRGRRFVPEAVLRTPAPLSAPFPHPLSPDTRPGPGSRSTWRSKPICFTMQLRCQT